jgi:hypothetical protein
MDSITPQEAVQATMDRLAERRQTGREAGYEDVELPADEAPAADDAPEVKQLADGGDPGDFTVPDVVAYLNGLTDDEAGRAEFDRVVAAEQAGKNRAGIVGGQ